MLTPPLDQVPWDTGREQPLVAEAVEKGLFTSPVRARLSCTVCRSLCARENGDVAAAAALSNQLVCSKALDAACALLQHVTVRCVVWAMVLGQGGQ